MNSFYVPKKLLITGCQRSGTTLLATALARHSEVSMLWGDLQGKINLLIGKKYAGVKLSAYRQIRERRATKLDHLLNRIISLFRNKNRYRVFPTNSMCFDDFDKIIYIDREPPGKVTESIERNLGLSFWLATDEWSKAYDIKRYLDNSEIFDLYFVRFEKLVNNPEEELRKICVWLDLEWDEKMLEAPKYNHEYPQKEWDRSRI